MIKNQEKKELAEKLGVENIFVESFGDYYYKDSFTILATKNIAVNYVGKTFSYIPLTKDGLGKCLDNSTTKNLLRKIKESLSDEVQQQRQAESQEQEMEAD